MFTYLADIKTPQWSWRARSDDLREGSTQTGTPPASCVVSTSRKVQRQVSVGRLLTC
jgi:hypothetical protein